MCRAGGWRCSPPAARHKPSVTHGSTAASLLTGWAGTRVPALPLPAERQRAREEKAQLGLGGQRRGCQRGTGRQQARVCGAGDGLAPPPSTDLLTTILSPPFLTNCPKPPNYSPPSPSCLHWHCQTQTPKPQRALAEPSCSTAPLTEVPVHKSWCDHQRHLGDVCGFVCIPPKINMGRG